MSMDKKLTAAVYAAVEKAYDHQCDIEDAADEILEIIEADRKHKGESVARLVALYDAAKSKYRAECSAYYEGQADAYDMAIQIVESAAPQPAEPVKSHLKVSYDDKGDCLYVVCDSNEPADAEEDDKGILYRRAISDGRLVGITIMNFMGQYAKWSDDVQRPAEPVKVPSDSAIMFEWSQIPNTGDMRVDLIAFARALLARYTTTKEQP